MGDYLTFGTALIILIIIILLRKEIPKLVDWIISFRKITAPGKGISLEGYTELENPKEKEAEYLEKEIKTDETKKKGITDDNWMGLYFEKKYDDAIQIIDKLISESTILDKKIEFESIKGLMKYNIDRKDGVDYFESLLNKYQNNQRTYQWYTLSLYWSKKYDDCLEVISRGIKNVSDISKLITIKVDCLNSMGNTPEAIKTLIFSIESGTSIPIHYKKLCDLLKDDPESKYNWYRKGIEAFPDDKDLKENFASFLDDLQKYNESLVQYIDLIEIEPENTSYLGLLGNCYLNNDLNNRALESYRKANELAKEKEGWILANIGNLFKNQGFYSEAILFLKKALELDPDSEYSHDRLAKSIKLKTEENNKFNEILTKARNINKFTNGTKS